MMFQNKFVASIRVNGKILRENKGVITLPFGAEYEVSLRNMNSRRAMVSVSVDGQDVTGGTRLILQPNSSITLERFIRNGNLSSGNKLKFIERTASVEAHRGIGEQDGLLRCEFWGERESPGFRGQSINQNVSYSSNYSGPTASAGEDFTSSLNDTGITVAGSESNQQFHSVLGFPVEDTSTVIVLQLRGEIAGVPVVKPITVEYKPTCTSCGKVNKAANKFCSECGTALILI